MSKYKFTEHPVLVPNHDCDVVLVFPNGETLTVQCRPSNADENYNGSLDIILWDNEAVTCWEGDDMKVAPPVSKGSQHERLAKQLVMTLPYDSTAKKLPKAVLQCIGNGTHLKRTDGYDNCALCGHSYRPES